jgi:hypothetical protein
MKVGYGPFAASVKEGGKPTFAADANKQVDQ